MAGYFLAAGFLAGAFALESEAFAGFAAGFLAGALVLESAAALAGFAALAAGFAAVLAGFAAAALAAAGFAALAAGFTAFFFPSSPSIIQTSLHRLFCFTRILTGL
jgi:hypothetical protein